ncbi:MAG: DUF721 domain-containing protein [Candidatus Cloacimonetes bacterium]|nr:DUF721 domain-containing protein [Candidatus Cloacimonadota bacterium]MBS3767289.1 DUF721 domain-containing protein [Candidatus Cloacimonadota bacterium]
MSRLKHVSKILDTLWGNLSKQGFTREIKIAVQWNKAVGHLLRRKTQIKKLENDVLFISVENNVWLQELLLKKEDIIQTINKKLSRNNRIKNIVFSISSQKRIKL